MRIAMVSEHASPLAVLGGVDAGGQNVHVAALADGARAARRRRRRPHAPRRPAAAARASRSRPGVEVDHVDAGPPRDGAEGRAAAVHGRVRRRAARRSGRDDPPDVVHAHFWMSGLAALDAAARRSASRSCTRSTRSATVKRRHQGDAGHEPAAAALAHRARDRARPSTASSRRARDEVFELHADGRRPRAHRPSCPAASTSSRFRAATARATPRRPARHRLAGGVPAGGAQGHRRRDRARSPSVPGAELRRRRRPRARRRWRPTPRRSGCARSRDAARRRRPRRAARPRRARRDVPALLRSADAVVVRPVVRAVRHRAAGGDGVRRARSSRPPSAGMIDTVVDGVTGVHVPPRDPARARRGRCASCSRDPARRARLRRRRRAPRAAAVRLATASRAATRDVYRQAHGAARSPPERRDERDPLRPALPRPTHLDEPARAARRALSTREADAARPLGPGAGRGGCSTAGGCSPPATAAAPPGAAPDRRARRPLPRRPAAVRAIALCTPRPRR